MGNLKERRIALGLQQKDVAEQVGWNVRKLLLIESGRQVGTPEQIQQIEEALVTLRANIDEGGESMPRLKERRKSIDLSQKQLAEELHDLGLDDWNARTVGSVEGGRRNVSAHERECIEAVFAQFTEPKPKGGERPECLDEKASGGEAIVCIRRPHPAEPKKHTYIKRKRFYAEIKARVR